MIYIYIYTNMFFVFHRCVFKLSLPQGSISNLAWILGEVLILKHAHFAAHACRLCSCLTWNAFRPEHFVWEEEFISISRLRLVCF